MVTPAITVPEVVQPAVDPSLLTAATPETSALSATAPAPETAAPRPETPAPPVTPPVGPSEVQQLRQRLAQVEAEREATATEAALTQEAQQVYQEEMAAGQTEADARRIAGRHLTLARRVHTRERELRMQGEILQGKQNAAVALGAQYGVNPTMLMKAVDLDDMHAIGQREQRYANQEKDIQMLKRGQVPAQNLSATGISQAGGPAVTADNIDALHLEGKVTDVAYRKFLETGQLR